MMLQGSKVEKLLRHLRNCIPKTFAKWPPEKSKDVLVCAIFKNKFIYFIYLFLAASVLRCCPRAFSSCGERGLLVVAVHGLLLIAVASLVAEHGL